MLNRFLTPVVLAGLASVLTTAAKAAEELHPIAADVKAKLANPDQAFTMIVELNVAEGRGVDLIAALAKPSRETAKEPGNLAYRLSRNVEEPTEFVLYERWENVAALDSHLKQPYLTKLLADFGKLLTEPPEVEVHFPITFE